MSIFRGAFTALITPMKADGSVDFEGFRKNVKHQLQEGIDGLVPLGTTAETPTLDEKPGSEEDQIIQIVFEEVRAFEKETGKKIPVILGAGSNNTKDAVAYVERAKAAGADAALVVTPYYNKPSKEGIYQHFAAVSKVGIPIIVYNIAGRTGLNIPTDLLARIAELPNIAGVKEASGSVAQMMEVIGQIKNKKPDFAVMSGDELTVLAVNRSLTEDGELELDLRGFGTPELTEHRQLWHEDLKAVNTADEPEKVAPSAGDGRTLRRHSWNVLRYKLK